MDRWIDTGDMEIKRDIDTERQSEKVVVLEREREADRFRDEEKDRQKDKETTKEI
jgi:hypothetical protein